MYKKISISIILFSLLYLTSFIVSTLTYDTSIVNNLKEYEKNIVDYANGNDWFSISNVELGDAGAYDTEYEEPELKNNNIEPMGKFESENFSYFVDLESDMYYQIYENEKNIYFVQWKPNDLSMPTLIEYYSK